MNLRGFFAAIALTVAASIAGPVAASARADHPTTPGCDAGWIYFDLGNTLLNTTEWEHLKYFPETQAYIAQARALGFHLGLISNVPESWGKTAAEKIARLKAEVLIGFKDSGASFDWSPFEAIFVPLTDAERKPAPVLFERAIAAHPTCPHFYQGDEADQCEAADRIGVESYQVNVPGRSFYLPLPTALTPR